MCMSAYKMSNKDSLAGEISNIEMVNRIKKKKVKLVFYEIETYQLFMIHSEEQTKCYSASNLISAGISAVRHNVLLLSSLNVATQ